MQTETMWAAPLPQGRASSERFMNDSDNRLNKGEDKSGSIYFLSRAPTIIYHRHSAVLMPLEKHTVAFCRGVGGWGVWACSEISGQGWLFDGSVVEPTMRLFFFFSFYKQGSLRWRALCLSEWQFTNTIISTNPLSSPTLSWLPNNPATGVLQTVVHSFLPHSQSPASLRNDSVFHSS